MSTRIDQELRAAAAAAPSLDGADGVENGNADADPTYRTLADMDASPSGPLLLGMLEPEAPTLLYGCGGVGKGMAATWMMRELLALGTKPLLYDAENRPKEWARRADGLGIDRTRIVYVQPRDLPKELRGQPAWLVVPHLGGVGPGGRLRVRKR